jgi:hypothetical protein
MRSGYKSSIGPSASSDFSNARVPSFGLTPASGSTPKPSRPSVEDVTRTDIAGNKVNLSGEQKRKLQDAINRSGMKKGGKVKKFASGGSTQYPIKIDLDKAKRDTAARDAKAAEGKRTPREEKEKKDMEKAYPFNKYAAGGGVTKQMPSANQMGSMGMAKGGMTKKCAKGGGMERKGKTGTKMVKMASGGSIDGIAQRGKTRCKGMK